MCMNDTVNTHCGIYLSVRFKETYVENSMNLALSRRQTQYQKKKTVEFRMDRRIFRIDIKLF